MKAGGRTQTATGTQLPQEALIWQRRVIKTGPSRISVALTPPVVAFAFHFAGWASPISSRGTTKLFWEWCDGLRAFSGTVPPRSHAGSGTLQPMLQPPSMTGRTTFSKCFWHVIAYVDLHRSTPKCKSFTHTDRWHLMCRCQRLGVTYVLKIPHLQVHTGCLHAHVPNLKKPNL